MFFTLIEKKKGENMKKVDSKGTRNVAKLAVSQLRRSMQEVENRMRYFKEIGESTAVESEEMVRLNKEKKKYEGEINEG